MKKFLGKAKEAIHDTVHDHRTSTSMAQPQRKQQVVMAPDTSSTIRTPTALEVLRYRYHHGTNLGSIFVLEKWLTSSMFPPNAANDQSSELAAVTASVRAIGLDATRSKFENHWRNAASDGDFDWLVNVAHCTSIRLPIGYFTLGPNFCVNTPFAPVAQVYSNAWPTVKSLVSRARAHGIGVLLDFHALPGGANGGEHSGTNSGKTELWGNRANLELAQRCLEFIAYEAIGMDGVIGLQLCNEAVWEAPGMYAWYDGVIAAIGRIDNSLPIYISDAWNLGTAVTYIGGKNHPKSGPSNPVIIDTHLYWAFSDADKAKSPQQIIAEVGGKLSELNGKDGNVTDHGAAQVIVGEYSCVLDEESWNKRGGADRAQLVKQFGQAQSKRWQERSGGSYFWTYKMDWMDGGEWGWAAQTKSGAIAPPPNLLHSLQDIKTRISRAESQRDARGAAALQSHSDYWSRTAPSQRFEHWRYESGWKVGFADALAFFGMRSSGALAGSGGDKIGCLEVWVRKRIGESGMGGAFVWEFEQGLRQGVRDFYELAGV